MITPTRVAGGMAKRWTWLFLAGLLCFTEAAAQNPTQPSQETINQRIVEIFKVALARGTGTTPEGYRFTMGKVYYTLEEADEVRKYGERAIAPLSEYLSKDDMRAQQLAIRFLAAIGGPRVVKILGNVAEKAQSSATRYIALLCLQQYAWQDIEDVVRRISENDENANVKSQAHEMVKKHDPGE